MKVNTASVKTRLLVSVGSNAVRAAITFATGLIIARALRPSAYGDLMFLLGSFIALRPLLDMGGSSAFFTFLSQRARGVGFYLLYFAWLVFQFVLALLLVGVLLPQSVFEKVWLGHDRGLVMLAFVASFLQQQVWQTVGQIGEAGRKTVKVQFLNMLVALVYVSSVAVFTVFANVTVERILVLLIAQYLMITMFAVWFLRGSEMPTEGHFSAKATLLEYWYYCRPLIALSLISFCFDFADKWLLQRFGGAVQQGYFQVANQISAISLLATASILNVFWKEIAAAWAASDFERVARLYRKVNRGLVMLAAVLTGFLLPWAKQIVGIVLGESYLPAWPVLAIMLLYPIHQSMGQIGGTMLYASGQTKKYMTVSALVMLASIPVSYLMLAPRSGVLIPGLGLEAVGLAAKMVLLGAISVNVQAWVIGRACGWKLDWLFQVVGISLMVCFGYVARFAAGAVWDIQVLSAGQLLVPVLASGLVYTCLAIGALWHFPWLVGLERRELSALFANLARRRKTTMEV
jgi:O-antigen/teichoic acid export membrane protein